MTCDHFQQYIYLFKEGELTPVQEKQLKDHLSKCQNCSRDFGKIEKSLDSFSVHSQNLLTNYTVNPKFADDLLAGLPERSESSIVDKLLSKLDYLFVPALIKGVSFLIILSFFIHEFYMINRIAALEDQVKQLSGVAHRNISPQRLDKVLDYSLSNREILSSEEVITLLNTSFRIEITGELIQKIINTIPELKTITIKNGINNKEMHRIMNHSQLILHKYNLFRLKGDTHV